jgi:hypothetical protein
MPIATWLFVKGSESIWIERPFGFSLIVAGPGTSRARHDFANERELDAFQMATAEQLAEGGWFLWAFDRDRRSGRDRRGAERQSPGRRRPLMADEPQGSRADVHS